MQTPTPHTAMLQARGTHAPPPAMHRPITVREIVHAPNTNISAVLTLWIQATDSVPEVEDRQAPCEDNILLPATVLCLVHVNNELQTPTDVCRPDTDTTDVCLLNTNIE